MSQPTTPAQLNLKRLRRQRQMTQHQVAASLGTTQQTVARWERGENDIPVTQLKELALLFDVSVDHILGMDTAEKGGHSPFAMPTEGNSVPYGTLRVTLTSGTAEYPVDNAARLSLLGQLEAFDLQSEKATQSWLYGWSLDNKIMFFNPASVVEVELISDDVEQMPHFAHPEVYQALEDWDYPDYELGSNLRAACEGVMERLGQEMAIQSATQVRVVMMSGQVGWHALLSPEDTIDYFALHLEAFDGIRPQRMIRVESEGYHRERYINLSQAALLEIPTNRYHKLVSAEA